MGEGEEAGALHLGGRREEDDGLLLAGAFLAFEELELAHALAAAPRDDELHALVPIVPATGRVVQLLRAVEDVARRLGGGHARDAERTDQHDGCDSPTHAPP